MSIIAGVFLSVILILLFIYYLSKRKFDYWEKRNVPYLKPAPFVGNYGDYIFLKKYSGQVAQKLCEQFPNEPYFGTFYGTEPALMIQSPEIVRQVFTKDFYYFNGREVSNYNHREMVTQNLFFSHGDRWKVVRQNLTPLFSSAKMKNMFYLIEKCALQLETMLDDERAVSEVLEVRSVMSRYTMDCIGSCAFGVETNTMEKNSENNPFTIMGQLIFARSISRGLKRIGRTMWPAIFYGLGFQCYPSKIDAFFLKLLTGVFEQRGYKASPRNDFVDMLLTLKQNDYIFGDSLSPKSVEGKKVKMELDNDLLIAQCVVFFGAGYETSASTLSNALFELAKNQEAQRRAQEEVDSYLRRHNNKLNYDCITELPYVEACVYEAIRMYPVLPIIAREVVEDFTFPTGLKLDKGVRVHLPVYHIHYNPDNFPDPEEYRPERFLPGARNEMKPYTFFPFGEGPRLCIGKRFAKMQTMAGLIAFLKKYRVELADGMPTKLEFETTTFLTQPNCGLNLKVIPRDGWEQRIFAR